MATSDTTRAANPKCTCRHPVSFHSKAPGKRKRPCKAFGCSCEDFTAAETATSET